MGSKTGEAAGGGAIQIMAREMLQYCVCVEEDGDEAEFLALSTRVGFSDIHPALYVVPP